MNEGFCLILLAAENTCQTPLAAIDSPFSTYFIGACMRLSFAAGSGCGSPAAGARSEHHGVSLGLQPGDPGNVRGVSARNRFNFQRVGNKAGCQVSGIRFQRRPSRV